MTLGSAGGIATAKILRQQSLDKYYLNPNYCLNCNQIIHVNYFQKVVDVRRKQFCNQSCAAIYNNLGKTYQQNIVNKKIICMHCGKPRKNHNNSLCYKCNAILKFDNMTKGELFNKSKNWQTARSLIAKNARENFKLHHGINECFICKYNKTIEICHIKAVSEFPDETLLKEINNIYNLIALCPNCHWEFDNKLLNNHNIEAHTAN
jgi:hypothetical protein